MKSEITEPTGSCGKRKQILFVAPLPPPVNGQSLASQVLLEELKQHNNVITVDMKKYRATSMIDRFRRFLDVGKIVWKVYRNRKAADVIYLTISESLLGNLKDLLIYVVCLNQLGKMFIHLHGGAGMAHIMKGRVRIWGRINAFFVEKMQGVIVLGKTHCPLFEGVTDVKKIHIVPNFAEDYLFLSKSEISAKFARPGKIQLLFLSNLITGKGHEELVDAFLGLDESHRAKLLLNIAGGFKSEASKSRFLERISGEPSITYHGIVKGKEKQRLFQEANVFCLPTYYPYEGQPISILEAYAAGCAVLTTDHSGIRDIFMDRVNGYEVAKRSSESIVKALKRIATDKDELLKVAIRNNDEAVSNFRTSIYNNSLMTIMGLRYPEQSLGTRAA